MLEFRHIKKTFFNGAVKHEAVAGLDLIIQEGEFFSLLGPSGCGKTTLLRMIAGLEFSTEGEILLRGHAIGGWPAQKRPFHMVFQKYALFPHLSVFENVAFGLKLSKVSAGELRARVSEVLKLVHMEGFEERQPETLSGGQAQRVAIARAVVNRPQLLLLDEPLSALDQKLREHMRTELKDLQRQLGLTFVYVTHDQEEALALSDRIAVMNQGRLEQVSPPEILYREPQTLFSAQFVGPMTILPVQIIADGDPFATVQMGPWTFQARNPQNLRSDQGVVAVIRPENLKIKSGPFAGGANHISGEVQNSVFHGVLREVSVKIGDQLVKVLTNPKQNSKRGESLHLEFDPQDTLLLKGPQ